MSDKKATKEEIGLRNDIINLKDILLDSMSKELVEKKRIIKEKNMELEQTSQEALFYRNEYENIVNSFFWRITAPLRDLNENISRLSENNILVKTIFEALERLKGKRKCSTDDGADKVIDASARKEEDIDDISAEEVLSDIGKENFEGSHSNDDDVSESDSREMKWQEIMTLPHLDKKIAVHFYLNYLDELKVFYDYLFRLPYSFDLYLTIQDNNGQMRHDGDIEHIKNTCHTVGLKNIKVRVIKEYATPLTSLLVYWADDLQQYDLILHLHSHKKLFTGELSYGWQKYQLDSLLGSNEIVHKSLSLLNMSRTGLLYAQLLPCMNLSCYAADEMEQEGKDLLERLGISLPEGLYDYPLGGFFWLDKALFASLARLGLQEEDIAGKKDADDIILRSLPYICHREKLDVIAWDFYGQKARWNSLYHLLDFYYDDNYHNMKEKLKDYDVISFSLYDILLTAKSYCIDDTLYFMQKILLEKYGIQCEFAAVYEKAKFAAKQEDKYDIDNIWSIICQETGWNGELADRIKTDYLELLSSIFIPRRDVLAVFDYFQKRDKKIVLLADTCLTKNILLDILKKCGYSGFDALYISSENSLDRSFGSVWDRFKHDHDKARKVHVGSDNLFDVKKADEYGIDFYYLMSSKYEFKMSSLYPSFKPYLEDKDNSLILGWLVNEHLFNSPFALNNKGKIKIKNHYQLGYLALGPLLTAFIEWVGDKAKGYDKLLYLSREGYLLKQLSDIIHPDMHSVYFLTSRRAASVSSLKKKEDILSVVQQSYVGDFYSFMQERFGCTVSEACRKIDINMVYDRGAVQELVSSEENNILKRAEQERMQYLKYIESIIDLDDKAAIIDVGYSCTIQFFLEKLLNRDDFIGLYLITSDKIKVKPGSCLNIYTTADDIFKHNLFLESAMQAPYGQLICFEEVNGQPVPVYKDAEEVGSSIKELQSGILDFAKEYKNGNNINISFKLAETIFNAFFSADNLINKDILRVFNVEDSYCSNGTSTFDASQNKWVMKNE